MSRGWRARIRKADGVGWQVRGEGNGMETVDFWALTHAGAERKGHRLVRRLNERDRRQQEAYYVTEERS